MIIKFSVCAIVVLFVTNCLTKSRLSLWMDEKQVEHLVGFPMKVYIVSDGIFPPYLRTPGIDRELPGIPPEVDTVNLTWEAGDDMFTYWFNDLKSLDSRLLYNPLLSIPISGVIPQKAKVFQMSIPCTGEDKGLATLVLGLQIFNKHGQPIRGSPMQFKLKKQCKAFVSSTLCPFECMNGGRCSLLGQCECAQGFYGERCEQSMCKDGCENNGTCMSKDVCICPDGFSGKHCERALCREPCQNGGRCIQEDVCWCTSGFFGESCRYSKCKPTCRNGGVCVGTNECRCPVAYTGHLCEEPRCKPKCRNNGVCIGDNSCRCPVGFSGALCEIRNKTKDTERPRRSHNKNKKEKKKKRKRGRRKKKRKKKKLKGKRRNRRLKNRRLRKKSLLQQVRTFYRKKKKRERLERQRMLRERTRKRRKLFVR